MGALGVLHVAVPAPVGGLETVLRGLALGHHRRGLRVGVVAVVEPGGAGRSLAEELRAEGVWVEVLELPPRSYLRERRGVERAIQSFAPDVLHTHGYRPDILDGGLARKHDLGLVTTVHGSSRMGGLSRLFERLQLYALRRFDAVVAVSGALAEELRGAGIPKDRIHVIRNGLYPDVDFLPRDQAREALGLAGDTRVIGWLGRLIPAKGPDVFVESVARLEAKRTVASMIGDGPMWEDVRDRARRLGVDRRIRFHGRVEDAARYLKAFDVFVLSSRTEGTPLVLLEAMAAGLPIVCTAVGGVPEVVAGNAAWTVPPEQPEELAGALRRVLARPDARQERGALAQRRLKTRHSKEKWLSEYEHLYRQLERRGVNS